MTYEDYRDQADMVYGADVELPHNDRSGYDPDMPTPNVPLIDRRTGLEDVTCHLGRDMAWRCAGCDALLCDWCDGTDNGSGLCWSCFNTEPDHETGSAA